MSDNQGVYGKYIIAKADGTPIDPNATYFVLRLDGDEAARAAMRAYADATDNEQLAEDITNCLDELETPPCGCREAHCPHERVFSDVWHAGDPDSE